MHTNKNIAIIIGVLFLIAAIASIAGLLLYGPVLNNPEYILNGSQNSRISWGAVLEIITAFAVMGTAIALYPVLKNYNERLALAAVGFRLAEGVVIIIGILCLLTIVTLNQDAGKALDSNLPAYLIAGKLLVTFHNWTFLYGPNVLLGPSTLMTAYVLYKTKLVPRAVSTLGLIGGPLIFLCGVLVTLGLFNQISIWGTLLAIPVFAYEMSLAIWLVSKGFIQPKAVSMPVNNLYKLAGGISKGVA
ncbi:MAG TPA: DUF4386 domain-containing protein [Chryseosolibacter sp.]|nr:DUF4386 domain-containing protein [Chryseosolibacter sp.]